MMDDNNKEPNKNEIKELKIEGGQIGEYSTDDELWCTGTLWKEPIINPSFFSKKNYLKQGKSNCHPNLCNYNIHFPMHRNSSSNWLYCTKKSSTNMLLWHYNVRRNESKKEKDNIKKLQTSKAI